MAKLMQEEQTITEFFRDKSIFITGATGFIGKTLIEKLLRSCNDLNKIYLLIRQKKGRSLNERLDDIFNAKLFDIVSKLYPDYRSKVVAIQGDLNEPNLGISPSDRRLLIENVNVVFHSAATVKFDEPLRVAVQINIIGTKKVIQLCKELKHLKSFIHISTAYAYCDRYETKEEIYKPPIDAKKIIDLLDLIDDNLANYISPIMINPRPNTYTYSKAIAESLVLQECKNLPCSIVRPSIVGASWREPFPGWVDGFTGMNGLISAFGTGVVSTMFATHDSIADIIPVDVVVNTIITAAWFNSNIEKNNRIMVYNCSSGQINKLTWGNVEQFGRHCIYKNPFENIVLYPNPYFTTSKLYKLFRTYFEQIIPAYVMDFFLKMLNGKPIFVKIQKKVKKAIEVLEYFSTRQWLFTNDNLIMLMNQLHEKDNETFNFDIRTMDWGNYMEEYFLGVKVHLMKDDYSKINELKAKIFRRKSYQKFVMYLSMGILYRYASTNINWSLNVNSLKFY